MPELAPLLVLCEDNPTDQTLREERTLIMGLDINRRVRVELLAVAFTIGLRSFRRDVLETLFREELEMLKEASIIQEWIQESEARGEARGREAATREMLLGLLQQRFGPIPDDVAAWANKKTAEWCRDALSGALSAGSLDEWLQRYRDQPD